METVTDFIFLHSKFTVDGDCCHEFKKKKRKQNLLLGRKAVKNLDSMLKIRDIASPTNIHMVKTMVFPLVMYGCESWTIKKLSAKELMLSNCGAGKTPETPLACNEIKPVNPRGNQSLIFIGRTDVEVSILWSPDLQGQLI